MPGSRNLYAWMSHRKMIVVRLMGGMGNQMFQYAAGRALAHRLGVELRYDTSYMGHADEGTVRHFELHHFRCIGRPLSWRESLRFGSQYDASVPQRWLARAVRALWPHKFYQEPTIDYDSSFRKLRDELVVVGRFQSHLYSGHILGLLREDFRLSRPTSSHCRQLRQEARRGLSVGVHVRRTDYVNDSTYRDVIQALPLDYYQRALARVRESLGASVQLYVVSDDIAWCRDQPVFSGAHAFVDLAAAEHPHVEEFEVLRNCRHFVISNSTFAWWAAHLSDSTSKLVIAPRQWSHNNQFDSADRTPATWVRL